MKKLTIRPGKIVLADMLQPQQTTGTENNPLLDDLQHLAAQVEQQKFPPQEALSGPPLCC